MQYKIRTEGCLSRTLLTHLQSVMAILLTAWGIYQTSIAKVSMTMPIKQLIRLAHCTCHRIIMSAKQITVLILLMCFTKFLIYHQILINMNGFPKINHDSPSRITSRQQDSETKLDTTEPKPRTTALKLRNKQSNPPGEPKLQNNEPKLPITNESKLHDNDPKLQSHDSEPQIIPTNSHLQDRTDAILKQSNTSRAGHTVAAIEQDSSEYGKYCIKTRATKRSCGKQFSQSDVKIVDDFLRPREFVSLSDPLPRIVFVTAASAKYFASSLVSIRQQIRTFAGHVTLYYDLGLATRQAKQIKNSYMFPSIVYRKYDVTKYGQDKEKRLQSFRWKMLILMECLMEFKVCLWYDASVYFENPENMLNHVLPHLARAGIVLFDHTGHNTVMATHPTMYKYLPTNVRKLQRVEMLGAGLLACVLTKQIYDNILRWLLLCSLDQRCIAPVGSSSVCRHARGIVYAGCHRNDQSMLNILIANYFQYDINMYDAPHRPQHIFEVDRIN